jgi:hypothetical protein
MYAPGESWRNPLADARFNYFAIDWSIKLADADICGLSVRLHGVLPFVGSVGSRLQAVLDYARQRLTRAATYS